MWRDPCWVSQRSEYQEEKRKEEKGELFEDSFPIPRHILDEIKAHGVPHAVVVDEIGLGGITLTGQVSCHLKAVQMLMDHVFAPNLREVRTKWYRQPDPITSTRRASLATSWRRLTSRSFASTAFERSEGLSQGESRISRVVA